ncbi:MAG: UDP-N-acetylmuramate--L-alanine ligase [Bacillota bacterium]|nr:MAG: UDP-N-acetylmuramate--L-alanine ligase [Bacillota bacterium]
MKGCRILSETEKLHFIGAGGIGMSALAQYALACGKKVSGSDCAANEQVKKLSALGVKIALGHERGNARGADAVVYTSAVADDNPELQFARDNGKLILKRAEFLRCVEQAHRLSVAVSGCHGKTTTTAMLAHMYLCANKSATCMIGGEDLTLGNFTYGEDVFLTEACEYKRNFLYLTPDVAVVLNIDNDHLDCYKNMDELIAAYREFAGNGIAVVNADDENAMRAAGQNSVSFGIKNPAMYGAENIKKDAHNRYSFTFTEYGMKKERVNLNVAGLHNVYNALAAVAAARNSGLTAAEAARGAEHFKGVKRRNEVIGEIAGVKIVADYAHHPKEIAGALSAAKKPLVVFQPHTYSRTRLLMEDFCAALEGFSVVVYPTYAAREQYDFAGSAYALCSALKERGADAAYAENVGRLMAKIEERAADFSEIYLLGAGDLYDEVTKRLKKYDKV